MKPSRKFEVIFDAGPWLEKIASLEEKVGTPGFWGDPREANRTIQELKEAKTKVEPLLSCQKGLHDLSDLLTVVGKEDADALKECEEELRRLEEKVRTLETQRLLGGENDVRDAILSINAGAGGTESCDWAAMLLRMYERWAERKKYKVETVDFLPGEEAGIKNVTFLVKGECAYGLLKSEIGVHRLVRISPFDANKRRHTSFASVDVIPQVPEDVQIEVKESDLRIDTYRSSGKGGQHVNVTDSAVRITHIPTGIVVQCQNERSQHKNRATAMKVLRARLYEKEAKEKREALQKAYGEKEAIAWGSQIRSYVFQPYQMVKDHRTEAETSNTTQVMGGDIDLFIRAFLEWKAEKGSTREGKK